LDKKTLRKISRSRLSSISPEEKSKADLKIRTLLLAIPEFKNAGLIMTYLSFSGEVDTIKIAAEILNQGKRLSVPRMEVKSRQLTVFEIENIDKSLCANSYGILEPLEDFSKMVNPAEIDLIIVPGLGFDRKCMRLGRGGAYYDRFLSGLSGNSFSVGLCYECQIADNLPVEKWDIPVDCVISEKSVIRVKN
jgi:5-formyltetrahydrofolate cyclo-ligase